MTLVSTERAAQQAERLLRILIEIGAKPVTNHGVEAGVLSLWEILQSLANPGDASDPEIIARNVSGAGIHDLAAKITAVWDAHVESREWLKPHLMLLAQTYHIGQNTPNDRWDRIDGQAIEQGSADKVIELYFACLCILCKMAVDLDDPFESCRGMNPDVIATASDGTRWAFALKTQGSGNPANRAINLADLLNGAAEQILRCNCDKGVVVVNLKNVIDHNLLRDSGTFRSWEYARDALESQVDAMLESFHQTQIDNLHPAFTDRGKVAPIVLLIAHATVLCMPPGSAKPAFTEIKSMKARTLPTRYDPAPGTYAAEVKYLAGSLNHVVQTQI